MFPYRDMRSVCPYGTPGRATRLPELCARLRKKRTNCAVLPEATALPTYRSTVSRTTSGSGARHLSLWTAEVSGPERTVNPQVRVCCMGRSSDCSHALSHAARRPLPEVLVDDPTMAAETASRQRGRGFAECLAALRQDTLVEIGMRELRCPLDRSGPGDEATTTRDQAS